MEFLVAEFDQGKFEEFLSLGSASPKTIWQYRKFSSETRSRISSEISPRVAHTSAYSTSGATTKEVLKTSRATYATRVNDPQETRRANASVHDHNNGDNQSHHHSPLQTL